MIDAANQSVDDDDFVERAWAACNGVLQRAPIDRFEASVVLEAHHGVPAAQALALGKRFAAQQRFVHAARGTAQRFPPEISGRASKPTWLSLKREMPESATRVLGEVVFMISVLIIGFWVSSMASELGVASVDHAWRIALPASLGAQWFLRRRYLSGEQGLGRLRREIPIAAIVLITVGVAGFLGEGWLGAVLGIIWSAAFLVARRGWWLQQFLVLVFAILAHRIGVSGTPLLVGAAGLAMAAALVGVRTSAHTSRNASPWHAGWLAAGVGAGLGALLVVEPEFVWSVRVPLPILTVVPSLLGSLWGAAHMSSLWDLLPSQLRSSPLSPSSGTAAGRAIRKLVLSAVFRVVLLTLIGSTLVLWWAARVQHPGPTTRRLLLAHALLAVAGLCVSLLEGFGRAGQALLCVGAGVLLALVGPHWHFVSFPPASRILLAAVATTVTSLGLLLLQLRDPARSIAAGI